MPTVSLPFVTPLFLTFVLRRTLATAHMLKQVPQSTVGTSLAPAPGVFGTPTRGKNNFEDEYSGFPLPLQRLSASPAAAFRFPCIHVHMLFFPEKHLLGGPGVAEGGGLRHGQPAEGPVTHILNRH